MIYLFIYFTVHVVLVPFPYKLIRGRLKYLTKLNGGKAYGIHN